MFYSAATGRRLEQARRVTRVREEAEQEAERKAKFREELQDCHNRLVAAYGTAASFWTVDDLSVALAGLYWISGITMSSWYRSLDQVEPWALNVIPIAIFLAKARPLYEAGTLTVFRLRELLLLVQGVTPDDFGKGLKT
jgi:hypothetical protein